MRAATYRLVTNLAGQRFVFPEQCFDRFESTQSQVANAVRTFAPYGRVTSVEVEQQLDPGAQSAQAPWMTGDWTVVKCWGSEVVDRILSQQSLQRTIRGETTPEESDVETRQVSRAKETTPRVSPRWRRTRYALAGSSAVLAVILVFTFLWQAEGNPERVFRIVSEQTTRSKELPFVNRQAQAIAFPAMLSNWATPTTGSR